MQPRIRTTDHGIERYIERVRPTLEDKRQASKELIALVQMTEPCDPPDWLPDYYQREGQVFAEIAPGILAAMMPKGSKDLVVTTVLIRGNRSATERRNRKRKEKEAKAKRRAHERYLSASGHRSRQQAKRRQEERDYG